MSSTRLLSPLLSVSLALAFVTASACESASGEFDPAATDASAQTDAGVPGELDPAFGRGGRVEAQIGQNARLHDVALQPDGKIIGVGSVKGGSAGKDVVAVARFTANGALDSSWGKGGIVTTSLADQNHQARAMTVQRDGKVVVAAAVPKGAYYQFAVIRYNANGTPDASFGEAGKTITGFRYAVEPAAVVVQPDGKIVVAGTASDSDGDYFALARYNSNGSLDTTFGTEGKVTTTYTGWASDMEPQPNGGVVVVGTSVVLTGMSLGGVRYDATGKLDPGFHEDGRAWTRLESVTTGDASVVQPDGKLVVAGTTKSGGGVAKAALVRFAADGTLDSSFGSEGKVTLPLEGSRMTAQAGLQRDGKIVVVTAIDGQFALARVLPTGALDTGFGTQGLVRVPGGTGLLSQGVLVQGTGRIIAAGYREGTWLLVGLRG